MAWHGAEPLSIRAAPRRATGLPGGRAEQPVQIGQPLPKTIVQQEKHSRAAERIDRELHLNRGKQPALRDQLKLALPLVSWRLSKKLRGNLKIQFPGQHAARHPESPRHPTTNHPIAQTHPIDRPIRRNQQVVHIPGRLLSLAEKMSGGMGERMQNHPLGIEGVEGAEHRHRHTALTHLQFRQPPEGRHDSGVDLDDHAAPADRCQMMGCTATRGWITQKPLREQPEPQRLRQRSVHKHIHIASSPERRLVAAAYQQRCPLEQHTPTPKRDQGPVNAFERIDLNKFSQSIS